MCGLRVGLFLYAAFSLLKVGVSRRLDSESTITGLENAKKQRFLIVSKSHSFFPAAVHGVNKVAEYLASTDHLVFISEELRDLIKHDHVVYWKIVEGKIYSADVEQAKRNFSAVITLGGDGTVLEASRMFQDASPILVSFDLGASLGHIVSFKFENHEDVLERLVKGKLALEPWDRAEVTWNGGYGIGHRKTTVLNEIVITRETKQPILSIIASEEQGKPLLKVAGDGLIISTAVGSSGYSKSAGGSVLQRSLDAFVLTSICPMCRDEFSKVVRNDKTIEIRASTRNRCKFFHIEADGVPVISFDSSNPLYVRKSPFPLFVAWETFSRSLD
eukprot:GHVN01082364.1.p1 GENE.GHVN01082364.1~~GHVN01082364.1.p1  ORF type:complete len:331 (+),score=9.41 GHVN01082364.1:336-1328(+)